MFHAYCLVHPDLDVKLRFLQKLLRDEGIQKIDQLCLIDVSVINITQIRQIIKFLSRKPYNSPSKAVVVNADLLTLEAQPALLKTLEEPPDHSLLILFTSQENTLLPTILSRCFVYYLSRELNDNKINDKELIDFWKLNLKKSFGERLKATPLVAPDRDTARIWLSDQLQFFRRQFLSKLSLDKNNFNLSPLQYVQVLRQLQNTCQLVEQNISLKLAVDHLFLNLPQF